MCVCVLRWPRDLKNTATSENTQYNLPKLVQNVAATQNPEEESKSRLFKHLYTVYLGVLELIDRSLNGYFKSRFDVFQQRFVMKRLERGTCWRRSGRQALFLLLNLS